MDGREAEERDIHGARADDLAANPGIVVLGEQANGQGGGGGEDGIGAVPAAHQGPEPPGDEDEESADAGKDQHRMHGCPLG